jgi:hypothetical protein
VSDDEPVRLDFLRNQFNCAYAVLCSEPTDETPYPPAVYVDELIERIAQRVVDKLDGRLLEKV